MTLIGLALLVGGVFALTFYGYFSNGVPLLPVMRDKFYPPDPFAVMEVAVVLAAAFLAAIFLRSFRIQIQGQQLTYFGWRKTVKCALADVAEARSFTRRSEGREPSGTTFFAFHRTDGSEIFTLSDLIWSIRDLRRLISVIAHGNPSFKVLKSAKENLGED